MTTAVAAPPRVDAAAEALATTGPATAASNFAFEAVFSRFRPQSQITRIAHAGQGGRSAFDADYSPTPAGQQDDDHVR